VELPLEVVALFPDKTLAITGYMLPILSIRGKEVPLHTKSPVFLI
jgi:hypothetical protein